MPIAINGSGTLTGISTGGISDTKAIADAAMPQGAIINEASVNETATVSASTGQAAYSAALISISYAAASSSNKLLVIAQFNISIDGTSAAASGTLHVAGSPSTSSTTYDVRGSHANDQTHTIYLNRTGSDVNQNYEGRCASSITIMEFVG